MVGSRRSLSMRITGSTAVCWPLNAQRRCGAGNSGDGILNWSEGDAAPAESVGKLHHTIPQAGKLECSDQIRSCIPQLRPKSLTSATPKPDLFPQPQPDLPVRPSGPGTGGHRAVGQRQLHRCGVGRTEGDSGQRSNRAAELRHSHTLPHPGWLRHLKATSNNHDFRLSLGV